MLVIKSWDLVSVTGTAGILFLAQCVAQSPRFPADNGPGKTEGLLGAVFRCGAFTDAGKLALSPM
jgi:hypothetical protein